MYSICGFSSSHIQIWELEFKENWVQKNWCFWTVVLEKTLESPLDCMVIQPVHPKGTQSWIFIGRTDSEAETPILWPPECEELTHLKRPWRWERLKMGVEGMTGNEMVGWHHWLDGHEFEQALGFSDGQESLACCSPWGCKESDTTKWLNWTDICVYVCVCIYIYIFFNLFRCPKRYSLVIVFETHLNQANN